MNLRNRFALTALAVLAASAIAMGQATNEAPAPALPKVAAGEILKHIPADCMGFVVVNNANALTGKVDAFVKAISPEGQPLLPAAALDMLKGAAQLGQGFNPNAPLAAVMLDPQQYGVDLLKMGRTQPADDGAEPPKPPLVLLIPGKDPAAVLAAHGPVKDGDYVKTDGKTYWKQVGSFIVGSPNKKAVAAVAATAKSVAGRLSAADKALIARNDVAAWVDFKIVWPIAEVGLGGLAKMIEGQDEAAAKQVAGVFAMYGTLFKQVDDLALGVRLAPTGIVVETRVTCKAGSLAAKALAAAKPVTGSLLSRLPNGPYVFAMGMRGMSTVPEDLNMKMFDQMMTGALVPGLSEENKAKLRKLAGDFQGLVDGVQVCVGGSAGGEGQIALAYVLECTSAEKVRALLPEYIESVGEIYKAMEDPNIKKVVLKYHKGLETVAGGLAKVDVISVGHPALDELGEDDRAQLKAILGADKLQIMVAEADKKTLVLTLGGGKGFLTAALKTAAGSSGKIGADAGAAKALAMLPKNRMAVGLLNVGNIFKLVKKIAVALGEEPPPLEIDAPVPLAGSMSIDKNDVSMVGYIPTQTVKNVIAGFMKMLAPSDGAAEAPAGGF